MSTPAANVFISYSHNDASLVGPVVSLLRVSRALVFRDADSIEPGKRWRSEIESAIDNANVLVVFWCHHALDSDEVAIEYRRAIAKGKDVVPLRLDDAPLPPDLSDFQFIDFRGIPGFRHAPEANRDVVMSMPSSAPPAASTPPKASRGPSRMPMLAGLGAIAAIVLTLGILWSSLEVVEAPSVGTPVPPPDIEMSVASLLPTPLLGGVVLAGAIWLAIRRLRRAATAPRSGPQRSDAEPPRQPGMASPARQIATTIESAVLERIRLQLSDR